MLNFLKNIGTTEIIAIFAVLTFFFGRKMAIGIGRASGQTFKEIKKIKNEIVKNVEGPEGHSAKEG